MRIQLRDKRLINPTARKLEPVGNGTERLIEPGATLHVRQPMPTCSPALRRSYCSLIHPYVVSNPLSSGVSGSQSRTFFLKVTSQFPPPTPPAAFSPYVHPNF